MVLIVVRDEQERGCADVRSLQARCAVPAIAPARRWLLADQ
jgi:hypothetical protein